MTEVRVSSGYSHTHCCCELGVSPGLNRKLSPNLDNLIPR